MNWRFWRRHQQPAPIDVTGPATAYPHHGGAYLSQWAAAARPPWDGPTIIMTVSPLLTTGQIRRTGGQR